jgi:hypothetical protein
LSHPFRIDDSGYVQHPIGNDKRDRPCFDG